VRAAGERGGHGSTIDAEPLSAHLSMFCDFMP
jgi:hypothetical protein